MEDDEDKRGPAKSVLGERASDEEVFDQAISIKEKLNDADLHQLICLLGFEPDHANRYIAFQHTINTIGKKLDLPHIADSSAEEFEKDMSIYMQAFRAARREHGISYTGLAIDRAIDELCMYVAEDPGVEKLSSHELLLHLEQAIPGAREHNKGIRGGH